MTPRELAQDFAQANQAGPSEQQFLAAIFAAAPRDPDLPLSSDEEGVTRLRRYAAAAAALVHEISLEETLALATTSHDDDDLTSPPVSSMLSNFINRGVSSVSLLPQVVSNRWSLPQWIPFVLLCMALAGVLVAMWRSMRIEAAHLIQAVDDISGERTDVKVQALGLENISAPELAEVATKMSRRRGVRGGRIDVDRTIAASVGRLGFIAPRFKQKTAPADYIFLLNRAGRDDHARDRFAAIVDALQAAGVNALRYDYYHDPRMLFFNDVWNWEAGVPLAQLNDLHPAARLILVSDGEELVNAYDLRPYDWVRSLGSGEIALLEPTVLRHEGSAAESLASKLGWRTEPATLSGLRRLADHFEHEASQPAWRPINSPFRVARPLPTSLLNSRTRLLSDATLDPAGQEILVADLRYFLGESDSTG